MKIIVDTCVWSLALRRAESDPSPAVGELWSLIVDHRVRMIGPIRQEILSGIRKEDQFHRLARRLAAFPDLSILPEDYVIAAGFFNRCRGMGIQGSNTDFLICAVAARSGSHVYTLDHDFEEFAKHLPVILHRPGLSGPGARHPG